MPVKYGIPSRVFAPWGSNGGTSACRPWQARLETHNLAYDHQPLHFAAAIACCRCATRWQTPAGASLASLDSIKGEHML